MKFKEIQRPHTTAVLVYNYGFGVTRSNINFHSGFLAGNRVKDFVVYAENEDGYLCFQFRDKKDENCYNVVRNKVGQHKSTLPFLLRGKLKPGKYEVKLCEGWFVSNCKIENNNL